MTDRGRVGRTLSDPGGRGEGTCPSGPLYAPRRPGKPVPRGKNTRRARRGRHRSTSCESRTVQGQAQCWRARVGVQRGSRDSAAGPARTAQGAGRRGRGQCMVRAPERAGRGGAAQAVPGRRHHAAGPTESVREGGWGTERRPTVHTERGLRSLAPRPVRAERRWWPCGPLRSGGGRPTPLARRVRWRGTSRGQGV